MIGDRDIADLVKLRKTQFTNSEPAPHRPNTPIELAGRSNSSDDAELN